MEISESFITTALNYGRIIISEAFMPEHLRTVKPSKSGGNKNEKERERENVFRVNVWANLVCFCSGQLGGRKYFCRGILVSFLSFFLSFFSLSLFRSFFLSSHFLLSFSQFKFAADDAGVFANHPNPFWASSKVAGHELVRFVFLFRSFFSFSSKFCDFFVLFFFLRNFFNSHRFVWFGLV